jgi:hypothetical protein
MKNREDIKKLFKYKNKKKFLDFYKNIKINLDPK